ncbi:putative fermentation associated protein [Xylariaceae sp. FL0594]|nr:putative fermentation associated protein [Xylariaceae sp. FL0594]
MADDEPPGSRIAPSLSQFNAEFLGYSVVTGVLAVFFLLYFNRVIASVISSIIRTYTWHRYRIYIDIQALQLSLLGGRLFFTGLRYHGNNETITIQNGHITWSYWLRRVRDAQIFLDEDDSKTGDDASSGSRDRQQKLPCRINVSVSGLEWFVYNRSPAYDSILHAMTDAAGENVTSSPVGESKVGKGDHAGFNVDKAAQPRRRLGKSTVGSDSQRGEKSENGENGVDDNLNGSTDSVFERGCYRTSSSKPDSPDGEPLAKTDELPLMLQLFPIHLECDKGALVMGNDNTKALLVVKTKALSGKIDAARSKPADHYRQLFEINFDHPMLEIIEHNGYKEDQLARAVRDKQVLDDANGHHRSFYRRHRRRVLGQLRSLVPYWRKSVESFSVGSRAGTAPAEPFLPGLNHWQGLSRYLNADGEDDKLIWSSLDYAAVNTIIDSPAATLRMHWDVPGKVLRDEEDQPSPISANHPSYINGAPAPAWTIALTLKGGVINYGPWSDRERAELQRIFFPSLCKDAVPTRPLPVGADRVPTVFDFYLELSEESTLRIPTREDSKNWKWKKEGPTMKQQREQNRRRGWGRDRGLKTPATSPAEQRPYGWFDIKIGANATVSYKMDMLAGPTGYHNTLNIDLPSTELSTSVNHGLLWRSGAQRISCDLSTPLKWNGLRTWRIDVDTDQMELFILREHTFLLIDLINDWAAGPPPEYLLFTPFKYLLNLTLRDFKLYLNVNDANIIDDPISMEENTYLVLSSPCLKVDTRINLDSFRPSTNVVPFKAEADVLRLGLHVPSWSTQATFLSSKDIGSLEKLVLDGHYHYNTTTSTANIDTLLLNITGQGPTLHLYGFLIRHFLQMKDNYFGDYVHFRTLEEYQQALRTEAQGGKLESASGPPPKKSNDLDVVLAIRADDPRVILPANLYTGTRHISIEAPSLATDLRFTNYYMELDLSFTPLSLSYGDEEEAASPTGLASKTQLFLDGLTIYGHRLFGLPPVEPTYLCNWDLKVGSITGEFSAEFLAALVRGGRAFGFSLDDDENALVSHPPAALYDVVFLRVFVQSIQIWLHVEESAFLCSTGAIRVHFNDWAREQYSKRAEISIPRLELSCIQSESVARHNSRLKSGVDTDLFLRADFQFALVGRNHDFENARRLQQEFVRRQDQRTSRAGFLLHPNLLDSFQLDLVEPVTQSVPSVPQPVSSNPLEERLSTASIGSSRRFRRLRHKSSFLSSSSSSEAESLRRRPSEPPQDSESVQQARLRLNLPAHTRNESKTTTREYSKSPSRRSFMSDSLGDNGRPDPVHTTVAFSSQFLPPYFPLETAQLNQADGVPERNEYDELGSMIGASSFGLENADLQSSSQNCSYQSILLDFPSGISLVLNAASLRCISGLLQAFQPTEPDDILDDLQMTTMSSVLETQRQEKGMELGITDVTLRLPVANMRFLNNYHAEEESSAQQQDQYDVSLEDLAFAIRFSKGLDTTSHSVPVSRPNLPSLHFRLSSLKISASERLAALGNSRAAAMLAIDTVMASLGSKEVNYLDVDVKAVSMTSSPGRVDYLASLIQRSNSLVSEMADLFAASSSAARERSKYFTHQVIKEGRLVSDPSFVVRPSAVLRAAVRHLRTSDSWKLITRLRFMWTTLNPEMKAGIVRDCLTGNFRVPSDVREQAVAAFNHWRSWDLEDTGHAVLLDNIFGKRPVEAANCGHISWMVVCRLHTLRFGLDPSAHRNQILVLDLTARVNSKDNLEDDSSDPSAAPRPLTTVTLYCTQATMKCNWELCELADRLLPPFLASRSPSTEIEKLADTKRPTTHHHVPRMLHFVFGMGQGSMSLDTINLSIQPRCDNFKLSVVNRCTRQGVTETNVALSCDTAAAIVRSHSQGLANVYVTKPNIIVGHETPSLTNPTHTIRAAASCLRLDFALLQDPVVLAEVGGLLIIDEAAQIFELQKKLSASSPLPATKPPAAAPSPSIRLNLAMFLDSYTITVPLTHSLTYTINGTVARATMAASDDKNMTFEFDVKENSHDMRIRSSNASRSISLLQIPPTNGRIISRVIPGEHWIEVFASLELVQLEASAVYSLLTALNRPEVSNTVSELQQQAKVLQEHVVDVFGSTASSHPTAAVSDASKPDDDVALMYNVHASLAGVKISGNAPIGASPESVAYLSFHLDRIHLEVANKTDQFAKLENPEVHINVRQISFDIVKDCAGETRSCGNLAFGALITASTRKVEDGADLRTFDFMSDGFTANVSPDTVSTFVDVLGYMGDKFKGLDTSRELEYLRKLKQSKPRIAINDEVPETESDIFDSFLGSITYSFVIQNMQIGWLVATGSDLPVAGQEDLFLSVKLIEFATRKNSSARLTIQDFQLQMVPPDEEKLQRSLNSALLPEMVFSVASVSTADTRRFALQAVGKSLDLRLTSGFIVPAAHLKNSIILSIENAQRASLNWAPLAPLAPREAAEATPTKEVVVEARRSIFGRKRLESVLVDADFAGAVVYLSGEKYARDEAEANVTGGRHGRPKVAGKYGQFSINDTGSNTALRTPGLAWKAEYRDNGKEDAVLNGEIKIERSANVLYPAVVPLIMDISSSIKEVVSNSNTGREPATASEKDPPKPKANEDDNNILTVDPSAVLGRIKLNLGLRICKQEFTLSCQPIGRVAATARFDYIYLTINTVHSLDHGNFFAISGTLNNIHMAVQHVYSRESTGSFDVDSIVLSLMNSKHVSGTSGLSAIVKMSPMKVAINARQVHDFLLFREIWVPRELKQKATVTVTKAATEAAPQQHLVQRYQQVAATAAFPWTATISISALDVAVDLGQSLGRPEFAIKEFWVSSKKTSDWEQNLCLGFEQIGINCDGRLSGFVTLENFKLRTSIEWPERTQALNETPKIQASVGFSHFKLKAAFDYQAFLVADITSMEFLMYNVRQRQGSSGDRLVAILDGESVQVFGITASAAQGAALLKAIQKYTQERKMNYEMSLRDIEKYMKRRSVGSQAAAQAPTLSKVSSEERIAKSPISLDTDVVVTLRAVNLGVFPGTFSDHQVLKLEALNAQARFAASMEEKRIHSILGLTVGQLRIGLASVRGPETPRAVKDIEVEHVVQNATGSRGGTILKVPKVEAVMETWQRPKSRQIQYKFKSAFEGKVEVGWNYSRITYIRSMWAKHSKLLAQVWGHEIPAMSAIKVTGVPGEDQEGGKGSGQQKITAEVNVPQSKYEYEALEPPTIETPQLRDMGEATPPLEWIGLHRDRLPNLTHQIVINALLELAGEVEDAYSKILGS